MRSPFGRKLFRAFLVFALAPAFVLVIIGFYLAIESSSDQRLPLARQARDLFEYNNDLIFARLDSCLSDPQINSATGGFPDFLFTWSTRPREPVVGDTTLPRELTERIVDVARRRPHGFVESDGTLVQYAGRLHRRHHAKTEVRIIDYVDRGIPMLARMFEKRMRGYRAMGYARGEDADAHHVHDHDYIVEYEDEAPESWGNDVI